MPAGLVEMLQPFRGDTEQTGLAIVADRAEAKKLLAAFTTWPLPHWKRARGGMPADERRRWLWLWEGFPGGAMAPDFLEDLARAAGLAVQTAVILCPQLLAARVVFPDGTISEGARTLLRAHVAKHTPRGPGRPVTKAKSEHEHRSEHATGSDSDNAGQPDGDRSSEVVERARQDGSESEDR